MKTRFPELEPSLDLSFHPIDNPAPRRFTRAQIDHFNEHGFIANVPIYGPDELAAIKRYFRENRERFAWKGHFQPWHHLARGQYDITCNARVLAYLADLIGPDIVAHTSNYLPRDPGAASGVPWHHDASYNPMDARSVVVWTAFDDAFDENGCMWFVPGSHRGGAADCDIAGGHVVREPGRFGVPVPMPVKAGHAVFFSDLLLHNSNGNRTADKPRDAFTATYCSARVRPHLDGDKWSILCAGSDAGRQWRVHPAPSGG